MQFRASECKRIKRFVMYLFILLGITLNFTQWTWEPKRCCETCRLRKTKDRILWLIWNPALFSGCHGAMTISSNYLRERSILEWTKNRGSIRHRPPPHPPLIDSCFVIWDKFNIVVRHNVKTCVLQHACVLKDVVLP